MQFFEVKRKEDKAIAKVRQRAASGATEASEKLSSSPGASEKIFVKEKTPSSALNPGLTEQEFGTLDNPFSNTLHPDLLLRPYILVDESQPSTIIAYALGSKEHLDFVQTNKDTSKRYVGKYYVRIPKKGKLLYYFLGSKYLL